MQPPSGRRGSPPRMRGKPSRIPPKVSGNRITPAHAGKTLSSPSLVTRKMDHPRACGENSAAKHLTSAGTGSPPRMRGKQRTNGDAGFIHRITPAHAGKTVLFVGLSVARQDHPRACGENRKPSFRFNGGMGSPPRMRGKRVSRYCAADSTMDHPRACGENTILSATRYFIAGSPPRMRGKLNYYLARKLRERITPAHAGKTSAFFTIATCAKDHPRACGENAVTLLRDCRRGGSPPRMRGKPG